MKGSRYDEAKVLIDRCVNITKSMRVEHTARFAMMAEHALATLSWVACEVLKLCNDPEAFQEAVAGAVDAQPDERTALDRTNTVHDVMRRLGISFS